MVDDKGVGGKNQIDKKKMNSMVNDGDRLYEQIVHPEEGIVFVTYDEKREKFKYVDSVDSDGGVIYPIDDISQMQAVRLPGMPVFYGTVEELIQDLCDHIRKYVKISDDFVIFSAYYILLSWIYDKLHTLPYMRVMGDTGCGKSRYLDVVGGLCYKSMMMAGAVTPAPIYRMISRWGGTAVIDEGDFKDSDEKNEVVKILNCGFERHRPVLRCSQENCDNILVLDTFGPKIISTRQTFKDKALESRCMTEVMKKNLSMPVLLTRKFYEEESVLRNKLLAFRFEWRNKIDTDKVESVELGDIDPRIKQATISFTVLFSNIESTMNQFRDFLKRYNDTLIDERAESYDGMLMNAFFTLLVEGNGWFGFGKVAEKYKDMFGMDTTSRTVGRHMRSLGFTVTQKKIDKKNRKILVCSVTLMENLVNQYVSPTSDLFTDIKKGNRVTNVTDLMGLWENNIYGTPPLDPLGRLPQILRLPKKLEEWKKSVDSKSELSAKYLMKVFSITDPELEKALKEGLIFSPHPRRYAFP